MKEPAFQENREMLQQHLLTLEYDIVKVRNALQGDIPFEDIKILAHTCDVQKYITRCAQAHGTNQEMVDAGRLGVKDGWTEARDAIVEDRIPYLTETELRSGAIRHHAEREPYDIREVYAEAYVKAYMALLDDINPATYPLLQAFLDGKLFERWNEQTRQELSGERTPGRAAEIAAARIAVWLGNEHARLFVTVEVTQERVPENLAAFYDDFIEAQERKTYRAYLQEWSGTRSLAEDESEVREGLL